MGLDDAFAAFGAPDEVLAHRGEEPWHDDVVFYYDRHFYLFWFQNRVWQLRVDHRYQGSFLDLTMGQSEESVRMSLGEPLAELEASLIYQLAEIGYPVRLRLVFRDGRLSDAYLYRADF
jgi:hypothetical protein